MNQPQQKFQDLSKLELCEIDGGLGTVVVMTPNGPRVDGCLTGTTVDRILSDGGYDPVTGNMDPFHDM